MNPKITGILNQDNFSEIIEGSGPSLQNEINACQVVEFRGDTFSPKVVPDLLLKTKNFLAKLSGPKKQILFTIRLPEDGGQWHGDPNTRIELWESCLKTGVIDWIDIEIEQVESISAFLLNLKSMADVKLLLSHHNFSKSYTKDEFQKQLSHMTSWSPDLVKFAVSCQTKEDLIHLLNFSKLLKTKYPLSCCISMGEWGKISRVASPWVGAPITYGFLGKNAVVPGQFSVASLEKYLNTKEIHFTQNLSAEHLIDRLREVIDEN